MHVRLKGSEGAKARSVKSQPFRTFQSSDLWIQSFPSGTEIVRQSSNFEIQTTNGTEVAVFFVSSGKVRTTSITRTGEELKLRVGAKSSGLFGDIEAIIDEPALATIGATSQCSIIAIKRGAFLSALQSDSQFSFFVLQSVTGFAFRAYRALGMQLSPSWAQVAVQVLSERARQSDETENGMKVVRIPIGKISSRVSPRQLNKLLKALREQTFDLPGRNGTAISSKFLGGKSQLYFVNPDVELQALAFAKDWINQKR